MLNILIVEDHAVVRDGVKKIVTEQTGGASFGEASTTQEALKLVQDQPWDAVILDLSLRAGNGLELLKDLHQYRPNLPVLILSMHAEEQYARRAFKAGAAGYITKDASRAEIASAFTKVLQGGRYVSSLLAELWAGDLAKGLDRPRHELLSDREFEVLRLMSAGKTLREMADLLGLSDKTLSTYRARLLKKMGLQTNAELIHYAFTQKLFE